MLNQNTVAYPLLDPKLRTAYAATVAEMRALHVHEIGWNDHDLVLLTERLFKHIPKIQSLRRNWRSSARVISFHG